MESFKAEVRQELGQMASSVGKLADSVQTMVEHEIRRQEREDRQSETNRVMGARIQDLEQYRRNDELEKAQGKQMREFLQARWPWLMVLMSALAVVVPAVVTVLVKSI